MCLGRESACNGKMKVFASVAMPGPLTEGGLRAIFRLR